MIFVLPVWRALQAFIGHWRHPVTSTVVNNVHPANSVVPSYCETNIQLSVASPVWIKA